MQRKLMGIINVDFDATGQLLIIYSAFVKYLRKNGNTMKQCTSSTQTSRKLMIQLEGILYNVIIEFGIPMKLVRLIKMCLNETCSGVWVGKNLSDMFPIRSDLKQEDALSPLFFNFPLEYAIRSVQVKQEGLKLNGTNQVLVYADDINILGGSVHILKKSGEALVVDSKEIGLEVNADKTKYVVMSQDQNARRSHSIKNDNFSFESVEEFKFLGTT